MQDLLVPAPVDRGLARQAALFLAPVAVDCGAGEGRGLPTETIGTAPQAPSENETSMGVHSLVHLRNQNQCILPGTRVTESYLKPFHR